MIKEKIYLIYAVALGVLLTYLLVINVVANILSSDSSAYNQKFSGNNNGDVVLGVSDSVSVSVVRNRWYGKIFEESGQTTKLSKLYLLGFIPLPINVNGSNLFWIHILFLICIIGTLIYSIKRTKKYYFERGYF